MVLRPTPRRCAALMHRRPVGAARDELLRGTWTVPVQRACDQFLAGSQLAGDEHRDEILDSDEYAAELRERKPFCLDDAMNSVPSIIIDARPLIKGGHPVEEFE